MNIKEIEELLEKYYEARTSLKEEEQLRDFFCSSGVPPHLEKHRPLFLFFRDEASVAMPDATFEEKFEKAVGHTPVVVPLYPAKRRRLLAISIAASFLILSGLFLTLRNDIFKRQGPEGYTETEARQSFAETQEALLMVSVHLNTGLNQMQRFETLEHAFQQMNSFNKFYQYQNQIINPDAISSRSQK